MLPSVQPTTAPEAAFLLASSQKVSSVELLKETEPTKLPLRDHRNNSVNNPLLGAHKVDDVSDAIGAHTNSVKALTEKGTEKAIRRTIQLSQEWSLTNKREASLKKLGRDEKQSKEDGQKLPHSDLTID